MVVVWEVVGGGDKGGILVRKDMATSSPAEEERLETGALVKELILVGERLGYEKLSGRGPAKGWVSIKLGSKDLLVKSNKGAPVESAAPQAEAERQDTSEVPAPVPAEDVAEPTSEVRGEADAADQSAENVKELLAEGKANDAVALAVKLLEARPAPSTAQSYRLRKLQVEASLHPRYVAPSGNVPLSRRPLQLAKALSEENPSDLSAQGLLGRALFMEGEKQKAQDVWKRAAAQEGSNSESQRLFKSLVIMEDEKARGNVHFKDGRWEDACNAYTRALDADPYRMDREMSSAILGNRSAANRKLAHFKEALADAEESSFLNPKYSKALFRRGLALLELERYDDALKDLREFKMLDPKAAGLDDWIERAQHWSFVKPKSHYVALGVPIDASQEDIKKAHKRMSLKYHPDKVSEDEKEECASKFRAAQEAFEVLSDEKQREVYDLGRVKPPPIEEKPMPKKLVMMGWKVRKGDGNETCMCCGFKAPKEMGAKQVMMKKLHIQETGHPGFYDK